MRFLFAGLFVFFVSTTGFASEQKASKGLNLLGCIDCFNFVAPGVLGAENINPAEIGLIVYDSSYKMFRGYNQDGFWMKLSSEKAIRSLTSTTTLSVLDDLVLANATSASLTAALPAAAGAIGKEFVVKKTDSSANLVTIDGNSSETIDGALTRILRSQNDTLRIVSDGTGWQIVDRKPIAPTVQRFTSSSSTYYLPSPAPLYIRVRMVGGGGGGSGSGSAGGGSGGAGGDTTFGTSLMTAGGGAGGVWTGSPGAGGTATVSSPAITIGAFVGGRGGGAFTAPAIGYAYAGGMGGASFYGGAGSSSVSSSGTAGAANSGAGGGGGGYAGAVANGYSGTGGGAGGFVEAIISNPASSFSFQVGAGGSAGAAGAFGYAAGAGASGYIEVTEFYQ